MRESGFAMTGRSILVVEDESFAALELVQAIASSGATPLGPYSSVRAALDGLAGSPAVDGAILDLNLDGEVAFPVAEALARRRVPFIFATGHDVGIPDAFVDVPKVKKPYDADRLVERLARSLDAGHRPLEAEILALIPALRAFASVYVSAGSDIDLAVSDALVDAIVAGGQQPPARPLDTWLLGLLRERLRGGGMVPTPVADAAPERSDGPQGAFEALPRPLREALVLTSMLGSPERVASVIGRTVAETDRLVRAAVRAHGATLPPFPLARPKPPRTNRDG